VGKDMVCAGNPKLDALVQLLSIRHDPHVAAWTSPPCKGKHPARSTPFAEIWIVSRLADF
jgi:hypothetical protein